MTLDLATALVTLRKNEVLDSVKSRSAKGEDPIRILDECREGLILVGERFQSGELFLAEMMLAANIFVEAVSTLQPLLDSARPSEPLGTVLLATLRGDIHDLGKNILGTLLRGQGFEVIDIGVDVEPSLVVEKVREVKPEFVGFSALITTAFDSMKEAAEMLTKAGLREDFKLIVGGGVTTPMVKDYIGADFQTLHATEGVSYCIEMKGDV